MRRVHLVRLHLEEVQRGSNLLPVGFAIVDGMAGSAATECICSNGACKRILNAPLGDRDCLAGIYLTLVSLFNRRTFSTTLVFATANATGLVLAEQRSAALSPRKQAIRS